MIDQEMLEAMGQIVNSAVKPLNEAINELRGDFNELKSDFNELREDFNELREDFNELKEDVNELKEEVIELEGKVVELEDYERGTRVLIESKIEFQIRAVAEQHGELVKEIKVLGQRREASTALKGRVQVLENVARNHTERIETLEAKAQ